MSYRFHCNWTRTAYDVESEPMSWAQLMPSLQIDKFLFMGTKPRRHHPYLHALDFCAENGLQAAFTVEDIREESYVVRDIDKVTPITDIDPSINGLSMTDLTERAKLPPNHPDHVNAAAVAQKFGSQIAAQMSKTYRKHEVRYVHRFYVEIFSDKDAILFKMSMPDFTDAPYKE